MCVYGSLKMLSHHFVSLWVFFGPNASLRVLVGLMRPHGS